MITVRIPNTSYSSAWEVVAWLEQNVGELCVDIDEMHYYRQGYGNGYSFELTGYSIRVTLDDERWATAFLLRWA